MKYTVKIIETLTGEIIINCLTENIRAAERLERGILTNLDRDVYHTAIEGKP